jgi:hypothetical protein
MKLARQFVQCGAAVYGTQQRDAIPLRVRNTPDQAPREVWGFTLRQNRLRTRFAHALLLSGEMPGRSREETPTSSG